MNVHFFHYLHFLRTRTKNILPPPLLHAKIGMEEDIKLEDPRPEESNNHPTNQLSLSEEDIISDSVSILNITELNYHIEEMFSNEKNFILILSPYLSITKKLIAILSLSEADITIVYREADKENKEINEIINKLPNINFYKIPDLHAKTYISQTYTIIASLNLYEHSQINNFELGVLIKNNKAKSLINKLKKDILVLFKSNNIDSNIFDYFSSDILYNSDIISPDDSIDESKEKVTYTYKTLYKELIDKYNINAKPYKTFLYITTIISNEIKNKFDYDKNKLRDDGTFKFDTIISKEIYDYCMTIKLNTN